MKIAVTGGSGFIGAAVIKAGLDAGHDMWSFDRTDGNDVLGELGGLKGADCVIHLAGVLGTHELFDDPANAVAVNVQGSLRVMQWCLGNDASYVGILMPDVFPSIYTATKVASKRLADALHYSRDLRVSHVRAFNAYGPGQKFGKGHPQKIIPTFATNAWLRRPLPVFGTGNQWVDLIHVDDLARMLIDATLYTRNEVFDGGSGQAMTVRQVANAVCRAAGWIEEVGPGPDRRFDQLPMRDGERETHTLVAKGEGWSLLSWRPSNDLNRLRETVEWYRPT